MRISDFKAYWDSIWAGVFSQTRISRGGVDGNAADTVRMTAADALEFQRAEPFGEFMGPPDETACILLQKKDGAIVFPLGIPGLRPSDVKTGDRGLYCDVQDTQLRLHGSGSATPGAIELKRADGSSIVLSDAGDVVLTDKSGHTATLSGGVLTVSTDVVADTVTSEHFGGRGGSPSATAGAAVGGGTATVWPGSTDASFVLALVVDMGTSGPLAKVRFAREYSSVPQGIPAPGALTPNAATPPVAGSFYISNLAADQIEISTTTTLPDGTYLLSFSVIR